MTRVFAVVLLLVTATPALGDEVFMPPPPESITPWYLPRGVFLGTFVFGGAVTPQVRVQWEWTVVQEQRDAFAIILEGGGGYALARPSIELNASENAQMTFFYQHMVMAGFAYRGEWANGLHIGVQGLTGPLWYGARFDNVLAKEGRLTGLVEGRAQVGLRLGPVVLGVSGGLGTPYQKPLRTFSADYVTGVVLGLFLDWRVAPRR
jgi:hypothetical protein